MNVGVIAKGMMAYRVHSSRESILAGEINLCPLGSIGRELQVMLTAIENYAEIVLLTLDQDHHVKRIS